MSVLFQGNQHCGITGKSKFLCFLGKLAFLWCSTEIKILWFLGNSLFLSLCLFFFFTTNNTVVFSVKHHSSCDFCTNVYLEAGNKLLNLLRSE